MKKIPRFFNSKKIENTPRVNNFFEPQPINMDANKLGQMFNNAITTNTYQQPQYYSSYK